MTTRKTDTGTLFWLIFVVAGLVLAVSSAGIGAVRALGADPDADYSWAWREAADNVDTDIHEWLDAVNAGKQSTIDVTEASDGVDEQPDRR